jgi:hypothetical protein
MENRCVVCGAIIPEGQQVCPNCEAGDVPNQEPEINAVMSWLEGLAQDDWNLFYSDSEVQNIAKSALKLLREYKKSFFNCALF